MSHVIASVSMLKEVEKCSTSAFLRTLRLGVARSMPDQAPLIAGTAAHKLLEAWLQEKSHDECMAIFIKAYRDYSDKFIESDSPYYSGNLERLLDIWLGNHLISDFPYTMVNSEYARRATIDDVNGNEVSDISDGIIASKDDGTLWSLEWKTTSKLPDVKFISTQMVNPQMAQHIYVCRANGFNVAGVLLGVIQFNKIPQPTKYLCRNRDHKGIRESDCWHRHVRGGFFPITMSPPQLETWRANAEHSLDEYNTIAHQAKRLGLAGVGLQLQEGLIGDRCDWCDYKQFCHASQRKGLDMLIPFEETREDIIHSGLVE
jgi:hypothetical protein